MVHYHDAAVMFPLPTGPISCAAQHHKSDEGLPGIIMYYNILALLCVVLMHHPTGVKVNGQHHFDIALHLPDLSWPQDFLCFHCDDCVSKII